MNMPTMVPSWRNIVAGSAITVAMCFFAWRGVISWREPAWWVMGVLVPAFGFVRPGDGGTLPPKE